MSIASLYPSINPSLLLDFANVKRLDPRITFTRTTTATYYDGVTTAKAEENLLQYSQEFDNAYWSKNDVTVTANSTVAPDGTTTADTIVINNTLNATGVYKQIASGGSGYSFSCYAKQGTTPYFSLATDNITGSYANFDLNAGTVLGSSGCTASITSVGNGWYRCSMANTSTVISYAIIIAKSVNVGSNQPWQNGAGVVGQTVFIWGAQLEQRSSATAYTATTTQAITNYIPVLQTASAGQARFDHNPTTGESLGLLIEEARTNLCLQSEDFNTGWTASTATVLTNATIAPNGTVTADKIIPSSTGSNRGYYRTFTASGATTTSFYLKYGGYQWVRIEGPTGSGSVWFDLLNGVKGTEGASTTGTITAVGNGWYRCTCTQTISGTAYVTIYLASADNSNSVTVATNDVFSGVFVWGAQAETSGSSFATSYIPTTTASATRNADAASMTGTNFSSWFSPSAGTMYVDANVFGLGAPSNESYFLGADNASSSDRFNFHMRSSTINTQIGTTGSGYPGAIISGSYVGVSVKVASAYATGNFGASVNSGTVATNTSALQPWSPPNIGIGYAVNSSNGFLNGRIKKIAYYPIRVTNAQLQALTV